jgi:uncharacterized RDD family membrane protein YckC
VPPYASIVRRILALIIDTVLISIVGGIIISAIGGMLGRVDYETTGSASILIFLIYMGYFIYMEGAYGATLGKKLLGIRVVTMDNRPLSWTKAVVRNLMRIVDEFLFGLVGLISILLTQKKQRLGDLLAKTIVIKAR